MMVRVCDIIVGMMSGGWCASTAVVSGEAVDSPVFSRVTYTHQYLPLILPTNARYHIQRVRGGPEIRRAAGGVLSPPW